MKDEFVDVDEAKCPICGNNLVSQEDDIAWLCHNDKCPVGSVQIMDKHDNPICEKEKLYGEEGD